MKNCTNKKARDLRWNGRRCSRVCMLLIFHSISSSISQQLFSFFGKRSFAIYMINMSTFVYDRKVLLLLSMKELCRFVLPKCILKQHSNIYRKTNVLNLKMLPKRPCIFSSQTRRNGCDEFIWPEPWLFLEWKIF